MIIEVTIEVTMGNICSTNNNNSKARPPRDLAGLIDEVTSCQTAGQGGEAPPCLWGDLFIQFLRHRDQTDLEHGLAFCVLAARLGLLQEQALNSHTPKAKEEVRESLVSLLQTVSSQHLAQGCPHPLLLSNQVLREELAELLPKLGAKSTEEEIRSAASSVWDARNDPRVWKGLDTAYKTFVANKPSPSVSQVLLSIL